MQRCPKCGYREGVDWLSILWILAFTFASCSFYGPKSYLLRAVASLLFAAGIFWRAVRDSRNYHEYRKLHPIPTDRVKDHLRPSPSQ